MALPTVSALVSEVQSQAAIEDGSTPVLAWLDRRHKLMCERSRCYRKTVTVGTTVAAQTDYDLAAGLIEAQEVTVGGITYGKGRHTDIAAGAQDRLTLSGDGGIFAETASAAGVQGISLFPAPTTTGGAIKIIGAFRPADLLIDNSVPLRIDEEAVEGLLAGVFATALARPADGRFDMAGLYEQQFAAACEELRRRVNRRLRGPGPSQIRVAGFNA